MKSLTAHHVKIIKTTALYSAFFTMGLFIAIPGPTLLDLQRIVKVDTSRITYIYLARSASYVVGSIIGGFLFDFVTKKQVLLMLCNLFMFISAVATPWCRILATLAATWAIGGVFTGAIDTCCNVICLDIWGKESAPYLQALHFAFGVGAFVAPLIAAPFLEKPCSDTINNSTLDEFNNTLQELYQSLSNDTSEPCSELRSVPLVTYPYTIIGAYALLNALFYAALCVLWPDEVVKKERTESQITQKRSFRFRLLVVSVATLSLGVYCGIEIGYGQMLTTYAVKGDLKLSKTIGSYLTSLYWGTFTFGRGISIPLATKFSPEVMIIVDLAAILVSCVALIVFGSTHVEALWAGTFVLALGLASFFPTTISWLERYIDLNNRITSVFVVAAAFGEMIVPLAVGHFMESQPRVLVYIALGCGIAGGIFSFLLWVIMNRKGDKYKSNEPENHQSQDQTNEIIT